MTVAVVFMALAVFGTYFEDLPCFCLFMRSLKNNLNLEYVGFPENVNHTAYIKLLTAYLANTASSIRTLLQTIFSKQNATHLCA